MAILAGSKPSAGPLSGGAFTVLGSVGGGGVSRGGTFALGGWIASAGAGTSSGNEFELTCGLVGAYGAPTEDLALKVERTAEGLVRIWWSPELSGYHLESSAALGAGWLPVEPPPSSPSYLVEPAGPSRYFRLRRP